MRTWRTHIECQDSSRQIFVQNFLTLRKKNFRVTGGYAPMCFKTIFQKENSTLGEIHFDT